MKKRCYVDSNTTPYGALVSTPQCEHCDGVDSHMVRVDDLRGFVCPRCDSFIDAILAEPDDRRDDEPDSNKTLGLHQGVF